MLTFEMILLGIVAILSQTGLVRSHGRLIQPAQRSSAWRFGYNNPPNYDDNQLFCGGFSVQWNSVNKGRCGACGDPFNAIVKPNEDADGKYVVNGVITGSYVKGDILKAKVDITAYHKGWFEFRLCPLETPSTVVTQECLNQNLLTVAGSNSTRIILKTIKKGTGVEVFEIDLQLPDSITCERCVLQWKYNTGNSWGCDSIGCGLGRGKQENFVNCADIRIDDATIKSSTTESSSSASQSATMTALTSPTTSSISSTSTSTTTVSTRLSTSTTTSQPLSSSSTSYSTTSSSSSPTTTSSTTTSPPTTSSTTTSPTTTSSTTTSPPTTSSTTTSPTTTSSTTTSPPTTSSTTTSPTTTSSTTTSPPTTSSTTTSPTTTSSTTTSPPTTSSTTTSPTTTPSTTTSPTMTSSTTTSPTMTSSTTTSPTTTPSTTTSPTMTSSTTTPPPLTTSNASSSTTPSTTKTSLPPSTEPSSTKTTTTISTTTRQISSTRTTFLVCSKRLACKAAVGPYSEVSGLAKWCCDNCSRGFCPPSHCYCQ